MLIMQKANCNWTLSYTDAIKLSCKLKLVIGLHVNVGKFLKKHVWFIMLFIVVRVFLSDSGFCLAEKYVFSCWRLSNHLYIDCKIFDNLKTEVRTIINKSIVHSNCSTVQLKHSWGFLENVLFSIYFHVFRVAGTEVHFLGFNYLQWSAKFI